MDRIIQFVILPTFNNKKVNHKVTLEVFNMCMDVEELGSYEKIVLERMKVCVKEYKRNSKFLETCGCAGEEEEYYSEIMENVERFLEYKGIC